ncbi:hypothetical protein B0T14DRAFT_508302 [Immersiella caudata]|uniref:Uncharacterized protein n=1 Tax=Immersiella caudata TaxID=314043 RepID=A0AA40CCS5_9PEZI|nr:hypothetical protein B0T14DRAFT_508302 [Immersiella caudata]
MVFSNLPEIYHTLAILHRIISIAWWQENNAHQHFLEFKNDIEILARNLRALVDVICEVQNTLPPGASAQPPEVFLGLDQVLGSFQDIVEQCWAFLQERASYGAQNGPLVNLEWHFRGVGDELNRHRDRVVYLNIKLSIALGSLNLSNFVRLQHTLHGIADWIDHRLHQLEDNLILQVQTGQSLIREEHSPLSWLNGGRAPATSQIIIPQEINQVLTVIARLQYGSISNVPVVGGVDEIIFYMDQATQWHRRRQSSPASDVCKMANTLRAFWLVKAIQAGDEYKRATHNTSFNEFQRQLDDYGMTLSRFLLQLEEKVIQVHEQIVCRMSDLPSVDQLRDRIAMDRDIWATHNQRAQAMETHEKVTRVLRCRLRSQGEGPDHFLEINKDSGGSLAMATPIMNGDGVAEKVKEGIDLEYIHVGVFPQSPDFRAPVYPIVVKQNRNSETIRGNSIQFDRCKDIFSFQQFVTGYKVVDDLPGAQITCQFSKGEPNWMIWAGQQWTEPGRVQLWTSNHQSQPTAGPNLLSTDSTNDRKGALFTPGTSIPTIASRPPMISKLAFEKDSGLSILPAQTGASRETEPSSVSGASMQFVPVDRDGNLGAVLQIPDSPSLAIFLSTMLLVVKVTDDVSIKPGRCDCLAEESTGDQRCRRVVLKSSRRRIRASRTAPTRSVSGYNICSAGRFQRDGMTKVERLNRVMIDFQSVNDRLRFVRHYNEIQQINHLNQQGRI